MSAPPRLARALARLVTAEEDRAFVVADLDEGFRRVAQRKGAGAARRWYWWQALRGVAARLSPDAGSWGRGARTVLGGNALVAMRSLARRPLYAVGTVGTLALGLTSAAAVFAVAWHVWLAPLPLPDPGRIVRVYELERLPEEGASVERERLALSPPLLEDLRRQEWRTLDGVAGVGQDNHDWVRDDGTTRISGISTSPEFFSILGMAPLAGRLLSDDPGEPEVVLTEDFWRRAFGGDASVFGSATMELDGAAHRVVGVVHPPGGYPERADVYTRLAFGEEQLTEGWRGARYLDAVARVRPGRSVAEAVAELDAFVSGLGDAHPQHRGRGGTARPLGEDLAAPYRSVLALLLAAGLAFLALATVNVSGLVAIRRAQDRHERGIRAALGASRQRILAGELVETLTLGAAAGLAGALLTYWVLTPIVALAPQGAPRIDQVRMDVPLTLAVLGVGLLVGAVVGVTAHLLTRPTPVVGRGPKVTSGLWGRRALVVGQVALTTLLATSGVAVLRHVAQLRAVDMGFEPQGVLSRFVSLSQNRHPSGETLVAAWDAVLSSLEARGIDAAVAANPPVTGSSMRYGYRVPQQADEQHFGQYHTVTSDYFRIMGIQLLEGRSVEPTDLAGSEPVVVVSEALARRRFPDGAALGEMLRVVGTERRIVGIVAPTRHFGPDTDIPDELYVPLRQDGNPRFGYVLMKTEVQGAGNALNDVLTSVDPTVSPMPTVPFTTHVAAWFAPLRLQLSVVVALGTVGLLLAALGLYALVAYQVSMRVREIGIRKALGAPVGGLFRQVILQGGLLSAAGMAAGLLTWLLLRPALAGLMTGMELGGAVVPVVVSGLVAAVSVLATLVPAWRSTAVDPMVALQAE